jgi:hypothetical protein
LPDICTPNAMMKLTCPAVTTFFSDAVIWGAIGPRKIFSPDGGQYPALLLGFPAGAATVVFYWILIRQFPRSRFLRQVHPVMAWAGGASWSPWGWFWAWSQVPVAWFSWIYVRSRYPAFWNKVCVVPASHLVRLWQYIVYCRSKLMRPGISTTTCFLHHSRRASRSQLS